MVGSQNGFRIYTVGTGNPEVLHHCERDLNGGIGIAEMVNKTNIMALVGGGDSPKWPTNKLMIWDDLKQKVIGELSFSAQIKTVKINEEILVVVLYSKTYIFNFLDLTLIDCLDTCDNPTGICEIAIATSRFQRQNPDEQAAYPKQEPMGYSSQNRRCTVMASLALAKGHVRLRKMLDNSNEYVVPCHNEQISAMCLSDSGEYLATVCENGQYIRLWGWSESPEGEMEPPTSLYMFDINPRNGPGLVIDLQLTRDMSGIAASILKNVPSTSST